MIRKHLDVEVHYNIPIFETAWRDVKILISVGIFVNAFRKEDIMQEIWDVSHKRCLERERVLKENTVRMKHLPRKAKRNYKKKDIIFVTEDSDKKTDVGFIYMIVYLQKNNYLKKMSQE